MGYAFISYSSQNQISADAMRNLLKKHNIDTWMAPYDIPAGSEYAEVIHDAIIKSSCLVLMLTDMSQNSKWVKKEVNNAIDAGKTIIPVKLEDVELNSSMKFYLGDQQITPVYTIDEKSNEIHKILKSIISLTIANFDVPKTESTIETLKESKKNLKNTLIREERNEAMKRLNDIQNEAHTMRLGLISGSGEENQARESEVKQTAYISAEEAYIKGEEYNKKRDFAIAIEYYDLATEKGHISAQCKLGEYYLYGRGVKANMDRALALLEPIAKCGYAEAQYLLGVFYHIAQEHLDEMKAREMYEKAARQGHAEAQFALGNSWAQGYYGTSVDYKEAVKWYALSAEQGKGSAQYSLGLCYEMGKGVDQNLELAVKWYKKAKNNGYFAAKDRLKTLKIKNS